ncbi:MAG: glycosyl hydrolase [Verrucomicrobiales bacterium]|jgi:hypothetical protein|nr:glycosyl hydrolase [Verrucomicrobiales bacterium]MEC7812428.1 DUF1080 domain-containing protein [Verrucomicrobiota bacterium]
MHTNPDSISRRAFLRETATTTAAVAALPLGQAVAAENDWIKLFDGKTLDGWHKNPQRIGHGTGGHWFVEDGAIVGEQDPPGSGNGGILLSDRKFGDFEVKIDMNHDWGPCSGFFLRSSDKGQCFQVMVDFHDAGNVGHIYGEGTGGFNSRAFDINGQVKDGKLVAITGGNVRKPGEHGCVYTCTPGEWVKAWRVGKWNTLKVRCVGQYPRITTWLNGQKICEFDGATFKHPNYDREKVHGTLGDKGSIAVQVHGGGSWPKGAKVRWRNILVREL